LNIAFLTFTTALKSQYNRLTDYDNLVIDTMALKYFPLTVGNVYKYHWTSSGGYQTYFKVRIIKDSIINSKRYYIINGSFPGYISGILRCDSATANIYECTTYGNCPYSLNESIIDSMRAKLKDTTYVCDNYVSRHICVDTSLFNIFGNMVKSKVFNRNTSFVSTSVFYGFNLGIIFSMESDSYGIAFKTLEGAFINGVLYGDTIITNINKINYELPTSYSLFQNYPNPFNPNTKINYQISKLANVKMVVYDATGKLVSTLVNEKQSPGTYEVTFDGSNLPSGIYFYRLTTEGFSETKKMILMK
jgi:hypothetical protein